MPKQRSILWLFCHPTVQNSKANIRIFENFAQHPEVTARNLYELYPDFWIDVEQEQELLRKHEMLVLQHPMYWYSMPPLMKLWLDEVLLFDFAYGPKGKALHGKDMLLILSTGGPAESYSKDEYNHFPISAFLPPFIQTANLCGMVWQKPFILHDAHRVTPGVLRDHNEAIQNFISGWVKKRVSDES